MERYKTSERVEKKLLEQGFLENEAYQLFRENEIGKLKVGYKADIIGIRKDNCELGFVMIDGDIIHISD